MSERDPTQADAVRLAIESDIFNGRLAPGAPLEEGRLATRFGVSRTPVREAITQLVQAGIVSKSAHKRAVVANLDPGTLLELFEALSELEGAAAFLSTSRMAPGEKTELMAIHEAAAENLRTQGDPNAYAELGSAFHQTHCARLPQQSVDRHRRMAGAQGTPLSTLSGCCRRKVRKKPVRSR